MSSILDALRRIERESGEQRGLPFELPPEDGPRPSRSRRRWLGAAGAVTVLGIVVALLSIDRDDDDATNQASPAPEENAEVALVTPEESAPAAAVAARSPAPRDAAVAEEPFEPADPSDPGDAGPNAAMPPGAAAPETAEPGPGPIPPPSEAATPTDVGRTPPTPGESPEVKRAQLRDQTRARREAVMAELAERRRERQLRRQQKQNEQHAPDTPPAGKTAAARPWQRVVAPAAEPVAGEPAPGADMGQTAHVPSWPEAGPSPTSRQSPVAPIAKLDAGAHEPPAPPLPAVPSVGRELRQPSAEVGPAPEYAGEEEPEAPGDAPTGTADTGEPAAAPIGVGGQAAEVPPADAPTEMAAVREEEILRRPPRGAPRVRVSFLLYSEDPGRRRVMLTVNDGTDLVTAYEGQRVEALEIARILPDEVHLRYEGKVFAVQPRY